MPLTVLLRAVRNGLVACALVVACGGARSIAAEHILMPSPQTVHIGHFLASLRPVLTIDSGDIVTLQSAVSIMPSAVDASGVRAVLPGRYRLAVGGGQPGDAEVLRASFEIQGRQELPR